MSDERLNLPSASGFERLALCPASRTLELTQPETRTDESDLGDAAHHLLARYFSTITDELPWPAVPQEIYHGIDINLADVVERFVAMAQEVYKAWRIRCDALPAVAERIVERRIVWLGRGFKPITSGKPDVVWVAGRHALILDFKSLNGEQTESVANPQLRGYVALVNEEFGATEITVAIGQPRISSKPQVCLYSGDAVGFARRDVLHWLEASEQPDAPLVAGTKQCKFCRARAVCPAVPEFASIVHVTPKNELEYGEPQRIVALLSVSDRVVLWERAKTVKRILDAVEDNLKALPADQLAEHGLEVLTTRGDRTIEDGPGAWDKLKEILTPELWNACCSVGITKLENAIRKAAHLTVKDTKALLEEKLGDLISRKKDGKALARIKPGAVPKQPALEQQPALALNAPATQ